VGRREPVRAWKGRVMGSAGRVVLSLVAALVTLSVAAAIATPGTAVAVERGLTGVEQEAPWAVQLRLDGRPMCSGSLIAPRLVVTARHCTEGRAASRFSVFAPGNGGHTRAVTSKVENSAGHDVALLRLDSNVPVPTVPLAPTTATTTHFVNRGVTFYGWGRTSLNGPMSAQVRKTPDGAFVGTPHCQSFFGPTGATACYLKSRTYGQDGIALHPGDSGGPWVGWTSGGWVQLAVERGGISEISPSSRGPEGGASVAAPAVRRFIIDNAGGAILNPAHGSILRDASSGRSWRIDSTGFRRHVPDGRTYLCLTGQRVAVNNHTASQIATVPDRRGTTTACNRSQLQPGHTLHRGDYLRSGNERFQLHLRESDGRLVLRDTLTKTNYWAPAPTGGRRLVLQTDGNVVLYGADNRALWSTKTNGRSAARFVIQNDGNLVLYDTTGRAIWASSTVRR
jgi:hypothetical protein